MTTRKQEKPERCECGSRRRAISVYRLACGCTGTRTGHAARDDDVGELPSFWCPQHGPGKPLTELLRVYCWACKAELEVAEVVDDEIPPPEFFEFDRDEERCELDATPWRELPKPDGVDIFSLKEWIDKQTEDE